MLKDYYRKIEDFLLPIQPAVMIGLFLVAVISVYMIFQKSATLRTFWLTYMISP